MVVLRYSIFSLALMLLSSCAKSQPEQLFIIKSAVTGCFTISDKKLLHDEPVLLDVTIGEGDKSQSCQCKSALYQYSAYQERAGSVVNLISGNFTSLNKKEVLLPISVQKQLIFADLPMAVSFSCAQQI